MLKIGYQGDALQLSPSFDVLRAHLIILAAGGAAALAFAFARGVGPSVGRPPCSGGRGGLFSGLRCLGHYSPSPPLYCVHLPLLIVAVSPSTV